MDTFELEIIKWFVFAVLSLAVWFLKTTLHNTENTIKELKTELAEVKLAYLHKEDFKDFKLELRVMFDEIKRDLRDIKSHSTGI